MCTVVETARRASTTTTRAAPVRVAAATAPVQKSANAAGSGRRQRHRQLGVLGDHRDLLDPREADNAQHDANDDRRRAVRREVRRTKGDPRGLLHQDGEQGWGDVPAEDTQLDTLPRELPNPTPQGAQRAHRIGDMGVVQRDVGRGTHDRRFLPQPNGEVSERDARIGITGEVGDPVEPLCSHRDHRAQQRVAIGKVSVQRPPRQPGSTRDRVERCVRIGSQDRLRGPQERIAIRHGVSTNVEPWCRCRSGDPRRGLHQWRPLHELRRLERLGEAAVEGDERAAQHQPQQQRGEDERREQAQ